jgi:hypothetical protein
MPELSGDVTQQRYLGREPIKHVACDPLTLNDQGGLPAPSVRRELPAV